MPNASTLEQDYPYVGQQVRPWMPRIVEMVREGAFTAKQIAYAFAAILISVAIYNHCETYNTYTKLQSLWVIHQLDSIPDAKPTIYDKRKEENV